MSSETQERVDARLLATLREMPLHELRRARPGQATLVEMLEMSQPEVSNSMSGHPP